MREIALERANNRCEWPTCINYDQKLEMAHLVDIGMGGSKTRKYDINNVAMLCKLHHDLYDGRLISLAKKEYRILLQSYLDYARN
jgi:predicted restriction endonuclease